MLALALLLVTALELVVVVVVVVVGLGADQELNKVTKFTSFDSLVDETGDDCSWYSLDESCC